MGTTKKIDGYWKGDAYRFVGEAYTLYGGSFRDAILLEGHREGDVVAVAVLA